MVRHLFRDKRQLICVAPRNWSISDGIFGGIGLSHTFKVPVTLENLSKDRIIGFLGNRTFSASMVRAQVPPDYFDHTVFFSRLIRNSVKKGWPLEQTGSNAEIKCMRTEEELNLIVNYTYNVRRTCTHWILCIEFSMHEIFLGIIEIFLNVSQAILFNGRFEKYTLNIKIYWIDILNIKISFSALPNK